MSPEGDLDWTFGETWMSAEAAARKVYRIMGRRLQGTAVRIKTYLCIKEPPHVHHDMTSDLTSHKGKQIVDQYVLHMQRITLRRKYRSLRSVPTTINLIIRIITIVVSKGRTTPKPHFSRHYQCWS